MSYNSIRIGEKLGLTSQYYTFLTLGVTQWLSGYFDKAEGSIVTSFGNKKEWNNWLCLIGDIYQIDLLVLMGRYGEAKNIAESKENCLDGFDIKSVPYYNSFLRSLGTLALVEKNFELARMNLLASIQFIQNNQENNEEWSAWSQAFLALAEYKSGNPERAKEILIEAISTCLKIQGYIPMVMNLPITLLILADEDSKLAAEIYRQVKRDPFLGKAQLFENIIYQHLPDEITAIPVETIETSPEHREELWLTTRKVLAAWTGV